MKDFLRTHDFFNGHSTDQQLLEDLAESLQQSHSRLVTMARSAWQTRFAGPEPSDACVSVRISPIVAMNGKHAFTKTRRTTARPRRSGRR